jgi:hypothetical protein
MHAHPAADDIVVRVVFRVLVNDINDQAHRNNCVKIFATSKRDLYSLSMENAIVTLVKGEPFRIEDITVSPPEKFKRAMEIVINRAKEIKKVNSPVTQNVAASAASELKGMMLGLEANYKAAKAPGVALGHAIDNLYHSLYGPLEAEYKRLDSLVSAFHDDLDRERDLAEAKLKAELQRAEQESRAKINQLQREKEELAMKLRLAEEGKERAMANRQLNKVNNDIEAEQISLQLQKETLPVPTTYVPDSPKAPGSRKWKDYVVEIVDERLVYEHHRELLKVELKLQAAKELAKALDEEGKPLQVPGLKIRRQTRTSFTGAATIRISDGS